MSRRNNTTKRTLSTDGWENPITGVGGVGDKLTSFMHIGGDDLQWTPWRLAELYETDDIAARIVDAVVDEAMRLGFGVEIPSDATVEREAIQDWQDEFDISAKFTTAAKWARLMGGSLLFIGCDDGDQSAPLQLGANLHLVQPYGRDEVTPARWYRDPLKPNFGKVSHYRIQPMQSSSQSLPLVHESRCIPFYGAQTTRYKSIQNQSWGSSVLIRAMKSISQFHGSFASALAILADSNQNVYKIKDFAAIIKSGNEAALKKRLDMVEKFRSVTRAIVMDAQDEDFVRSTVSLNSGLSDLLQQFALRIAAAARMPVTVLLGQSPAGLSATGESDRAIWQAQAETERVNVGSKLTRLFKIAFNAANGPTCGVEPAIWKVTWPALWIPTGKEAAEIEASKAATYRQYFDMGVLTAKDIATAEFAGEQQRPKLDSAAITMLEQVHTAETAGDGSDLGVTLAPTDVAKVILVHEARASQGLGSLGDDRDMLTVAQLDAITAAPSALADVPDPVEAVGATGVEPSLDAPAIDGGAASVDAFAAQMTQHAIERCPHGGVNRCPRCGIERVRTVELDTDGNHIWPVAWRRIGAPAESVVAESDTGQ